MSKEIIRLTILHTNDMHCELGAMSRLSGAARRLHQELAAEGRQVFYFDAGDAADRRVRFCSLTKGEAFPPLLAAMGHHGCDLQALGNAISVTYGLQAAARMAQRASFPILAANFFRDGRPQLEGFRATASFPLPGGLRLGVVGLTAHVPDLYRLFGLEAADFNVSACEWVNRLRAEGCAPLVVVSHLGLELDRQLAETVPGIDLIIGGHTHSLLEEGERVNGVLIAQAGDYAKYLGRVDLEVETGTGVVLDKQASLVEIPQDAPPDPGFEAACQAAEAEARLLTGRPVGVLQEALDHDFFLECGIGDLATDAVRERMGAEASILCGGLFHKGLPAGTVTLLDLDEACFTTANPQLSLVRGEQIRQALERGLDPGLMQTYFKPFRGAPLGLPAVSGMTVIYDPQAADGERVRQIQLQGEAMREEQLVRLAHTDAEVRTETSPFGLLDLEPGQVLREEVPTILREAIQDYMQVHSPTPKPVGGRWQRTA